MTPEQEQAAVRELGNAIELPGVPWTVYNNAKVVILILSQTQSALEQAQRERDEARQETQRAWGLNNSISAQIAIVVPQRDELQAKLDEALRKLRSLRGQIAEGETE